MVARAFATDADMAKPEGLVHFALARRDAATVAEHHQFGAIGRAEVRARSVGVALDLLLGAATV